VGFAAKPVHLSPPRNARLDLVAQHVAAHELAVLLVVRHRMRARSNEAHAACQDVEELRKLVERAAPQECAHACYTRVVTLRLGDLLPVFAHGQGPELEDHDSPAIDAVAALTE